MTHRAIAYEKLPVSNRIQPPDTAILSLHRFDFQLVEYLVQRRLHFRLTSAQISCFPVGHSQRY